MIKKRLISPFLAFLLLPFYGISQVALNNGLIAFYPFNGNANDATGNGNNGTPVNGPQLTADRFGNPNSAYYFDGIDDYISIPDNSSLDPSAAMSIALYFNPAKNGLQTLIGKIDRVNGVGTQFQMAINFSMFPGALFGVNPVSNGCAGVPLNGSYVNTGGTVPIDQWYCLVGTFDNGVQKIYLNGSLVQTQNAGFSTLLQCSNANIQIGCWWLGDLQPYQGTIDDIRIYNRALNANEVTALCTLANCPILQGTLTGSNICSGNTQGFLTFHSLNGKGPYTLTYTDGTNTYTQANVSDSVPFAVQTNPTATTTYTLLSIQNDPACPATLLTGGPTATITVGACSLCTGSLGDPVVNITFGSGANPGPALPTIVPGASTTLQYVSVTGNPALPVPIDGDYTITNSVPGNPAWYEGAPDHTPNDPNGYMAFYNSSTDPGEFYSQTVGNLCGSTTYQFAAWIANALNPALINGVKPDITFIIEQTDGTVLAVYDTGPVGQQNSFTWVQYGFDFTTPPGVGTVVLKMINNSPGGALNVGNDLAIDDITFRPCGPALTASFSGSSALNAITACEGGDTVIYGKVTGSYASPGYLWQVSSDSGATWVDITGSNQLTLPITPPPLGKTITYQYRLLTADATNISSPNCRVASDLLYYTSLHIPLADFLSEQETCNPTAVDFTTSSMPGAQYDWVINGIDHPSIRNLIDTFPQFGSYPVTLTVSYPGGCSSSISKILPVQLTPANIIVTPDTSICIGQAAHLLTSTPDLAFCWSPVLYLDNPSVTNPVATPPVTTTYHFSAARAGTNLVVNGNFTNGNTGFNSGYTYDAVNKTQGEYFVGPNPQSWNSGLQPCGDHFSGTGNMMIIKGAPVPGVNVWTQQVSVTPNSNYIYSIWLESLDASNPAVIQAFINGAPLGDPITLSSTPCSWQQYTLSWNSGDSTTALLSLVDNNTGQSGNDFALDDISMAPMLYQTDSVVVTVVKPFVAAFPDTTVCPGMPVSLRAGGSATYSWSPGASLSDSTIADPIARPAVTTSYIVKGFSPEGCVAKDTIVVAFFPHSTVILNADTAICLGDPAQLQADGGMSYAWSPGQYLDNPAIADPIARPDRTTRFFLTSTDVDNCNELDSVNVAIRPAPVFHAPPDEKICAGYTVKLTGNNPLTAVYNWSTAATLDDPSSPAPVAGPGSTTTYTLSISDAVCTRYDSVFAVTVDVFPTPAVTARKANDINCTLPTSQLNAVGAVAYAWSPAEGLNDPHISNPVAIIDSTTTFIVTGTDQNGCFALDSVKIFVTSTGANLFVVPNAFSPNGDGHNDCFGIQRWGDVRVEEFSVFDRWGVRVFTTRNPAECWDGSFRGKPQGAGVYAYVIRSHSFCGEITRTGTVILVR